MVLRSRLLPALLITTFVVTACGGGTDVSTAPGSSAASASALTGTVPTVAGGQLDLASIEGQDTVLWFWAPW